LVVGALVSDLLAVGGSVPVAVAVLTGSTLLAVAVAVTVVTVEVFCDSAVTAEIV
jgi:hypothetical protein